MSNEMGKGAAIGSLNIMKCNTQIDTKLYRYGVDISAQQTA